MLKLGEVQRLRAVKRVDFGLYFAGLDDAKGEERVLLPAKQVPENTALGDELDLFLYKDSSDRLIATVRQPGITLGKVARLRVAGITKIGAFLDWGLEKELLLPFREQTGKVRENDKVLVALYVDKTGRLCATMKLYPYLEKGGNFKKDDQVEGTIYEISENFGAFVAVEDKYSALIPAREFTKNVPVGSKVSARITGVHADGKIDLSIKEKAYIQIATDAAEIMKAIESYDGVLPFNDKASPETIRREMGMSKNEFKRGVGNLLKAGRIEITETSIRKIK
ncbi:MAG: S1 RNA-binding domain-containing protein [Lachnospiraceae bacterium]|nr:S1 RNA-binding domain-containing protein [Lachnospiraceae bacterium]